MVDVLKGDWLTQGPAVQLFEDGLARTCGAEHVVACANGTAALHLAALALGWASEDVVLVPSITFLASANCATYVGAEPFFVDIDDSTLTIDPNEVERHVVALRRQGRRVRAVVGVDMAGHPCDWVALRAVADRYGLELVDDASHALGAVDADGTRIGAGSRADITTFSFHPVKHITTAEGGAIATADTARADAVRRFRSHGMVRGDDVEGWEGPWHADMVDLGFNYRLSDLQAALGASQLQRLPSFIARRRQLADRYRQKLAGHPRVRCQEERGGVVHAYHLFIVRADFGAAGRTRREVFDYFRERGVALQVHYRPVFMNAFYRQRPLSRGATAWNPVSCRYYREALSLPLYPDLADADVDYVVELLDSALGGR